MHTSVQPHRDGAVLEYSGTLMHAAQVRTRVLDGDLHTVPLLCMDIALDNALRTHMHVEQPYPATHHAQATAAAHRLKKHTHVRVPVALVDLRLQACNVSHIEVIPKPTKDLFQEPSA
jgi:hypothetical protein